MGVMEEKFNVGKSIVHPSHGAGRIEDVVRLTTNGGVEAYYSITLFDGKGTLFVPVEEVDSVGVRRAEYGEDKLRQVFMEEPVALDDNYRTRQARMREKIGSGEPLKVAEALRDLAWREHTDRLTKIDTDLKRGAQKMLIGELAAHSQTTLKAATQKLNNLLNRAIRKHDAEAEIA